MVAQVDAGFRRLNKFRTFTRFIAYLFYEGRPLTTKGRWFNFFVRFNYFLHNLLLKGFRPEGVVFIVGTGRSGTTILGVSLGIHPDVGFLNEPKAAWAYCYKNEDLIGSYNTGSARYSLSAEDCTELGSETLNAIYYGYSKISKSNVILDKYPELIFRYEFLKANFPSAKTIFLCRNGHDTVASIDGWSKRLGLSKGKDTHDWWGLNDRKWSLLCDDVVRSHPSLAAHYEKIRRYTDHRHRAAVEWALTMEKGLELSRAHPEHVMKVKYEDYVSSRQSRSEVLKFCGLDESDIYDRYCEEALSAAPKKPVIDLPEEILDFFNSMMAKLGYE